MQDLQYTMPKKQLKCRLQHDIIKSTLSVILMVGFVIFYVFFSYVSNDVSKAGEIYNFYPIVLITSFIEYSNIESFVIITLICYSLFVISNTSVPIKSVSG